VVGLGAYLLLVDGATLTAVPPALSVAGLRLAGSATLSVVLTSWGMVATDTVHPPACATTLIVSLGLLSTPRRVGVIVVSVVALVGVHVVARSLLERATGEAWPLDPDRRS
ncbi:HPP family protein, partial [Halobacteriales archaeon SW_12_71_31]